MNPKQAFDIISQALSGAPVPLGQHGIVMQALQVVQAACDAAAAPKAEAPKTEEKP